MTTTEILHSGEPHGAIDAELVSLRAERDAYKAENKNALHDLACIKLCLLQQDPKGALEITERWGNIDFGSDCSPTFVSAALGKE